MVFTLEFEVSKDSLTFRVNMNRYVMMCKPDTAGNYSTISELTKPDLWSVLIRGIILNLNVQFYWTTTFASSLTCQILLVVFNMFIIGCNFFIFIELCKLCQYSKKTSPG